MRIFVTGGAGFIGSRFVKSLEKNEACDILVYDNLHPQVHGPDAVPPEFGARTQFVKGDVNDGETLEAALADFKPTAVAHLACETGTGQSHDEISRYTRTNVGGTALLLEAIRKSAVDLDWFLLTSSRSVYGEGAYLRQDGTVSTQMTRSFDDMSKGRFGVYDETGAELTFQPTSSLMRETPLSVYASTKLAQEHIVSNFFDTTNTRKIIFRFQNVYGAGQSLINPYTGVLSIFLSRLQAGEPIAIYEDGEISRDFVYVDDVVAAMVAAVEKDVRPERPLDVGSGVAIKIMDMALHLCELTGSGITELPISGEFRHGDIRHAVADISYTKDLLGWTPEVTPGAGLKRLYDWAAKG